MKKFFAFAALAAVLITAFIGFAACTCDRELSGRIFAVRDSSFNPVPMFALRAVKPC